jgi:hypothetical protein
MKKWTTKNSNLRPGDIILTSENSFLSKQIRRFMNIYRKKLGLPVRTLYSHAAGVIEVWGEIYVVEAIADGVNIRKFEDTYAKRMNRSKVLTPKKIYSKDEAKEYCKIAQEMTFKPHRYDILGLIYQMDMIVRTKNTMNENWAGPTGNKATDRLYCSELVATLASIVRPRTFNKPYATNPLDVDLNKWYKDKVITHD